jgi:hypothetical protein
MYTARQSGQLATCTTEPAVASTLGVTQEIKLRSDREIRVSLCADVRMEDYIRLQWKICYNIHYLHLTVTRTKTTPAQQKSKLVKSARRGRCEQMPLYCRLLSLEIFYFRK